MKYSISEGTRTNILSNNIVVESFSYLIDKDPEFIIKEMIKEDQLLQLVRFPENIINLIIDIIINDKDVEYLKEKLTTYHVPLYSLIINLVNTSKRKYERLLKLKEASLVEIECDQNNLIKGLELAKKINKTVIIEGKNITLSDYQRILSNYDISSLDNYDIKINYQEQNHPIGVHDLYETAAIIDEVIKEIERYNLSPLERIIYVYDKVKKRKYKKSDKDESDSRDLDKVLHGDNIVCVGFSNLFNAVLISLGIKAIPLISIEAWHQRSLVYIKDEKYSLNGVYVFDPTNDSRRNSEYIDNYTYFGLRIKDSEKDAPSNIHSIFNITLDEFRKLYEIQTQEDFSKCIETTNQIQRLFEFIDIDFEHFEELLKDSAFFFEETELLDMYHDFIRKYNPREITPAAFMLALCNTRLIECYNGTIDNFDLNDIKETSRERSFQQKLKYSSKKDPIERMFEAMDYDDKISNRLSKLIYQNGTNIERKELNVRLLKVLRKNKK